MDVSAHLPGYGKLIALRGAALRTGIYVGTCLSLTFVTWLVIANRVPALAHLALQRNIAAAAALAFFGMIPVLRFYAMPGRLWASGAIAWLILSLCYWVISFFFTGLPERYSAFRVFMLGAVVYTIASTICWIGTVVWRMRSPHAVAGGASHHSIPPSNHHMS